MSTSAATTSQDQASARALLAENLSSLRKAAGMSQEQLAFEANLHRTFVAHVERRARNISLDNIERLAKALGVETFLLIAPPEVVNAAFRSIRGC